MYQVSLEQILSYLMIRQPKKTQYPSKDPGANKFEEAPALQEGKTEFQSFTSYTYWAVIFIVQTIQPFVLKYK